ncbi:MAG: hypothetical protein AAF597_13385, partial [Bacteroidota bacterium]
GAFTFPDLPYLDTVTYVLQAARYDARRFDPDVPLITGKNRRVNLVQTSRKPATLPSGVRQKTTRLPQFLVDNYALIAARDSQRLGVDWSIDLAEVTVSGQRQVDSRNLDVFDFDALDWVDPQQTVYSLLRTLKPGYRFLRDATRNGLTALVNDGYGSIVRRPVFVTIDGVENTTFARFHGLKADMIKYLMVTRTSIVITTRDNLRSSAGEAAPGVATFRGDGFYPGQDFPAPDYATNPALAGQPDVRTTIHWEPKLRLEPGEPTILAFYAAGLETDYEVRIEGITDSGEPIVETLVVKIAE